MQVLKTKDLQNEKIVAMIYSCPGLGKTTLLGYLPGKTLLIDIDKGSRVLGDCENIDVVRVSDNPKEIEALIAELQSDCPYQNIAIDSLSQLERGALAYYGSKGKNDGVPSQQDYGRLNMKVVNICRQLISLPANIFFTAWEQQKEFILSTGEKYTQCQPALRDKFVDNICGLCDIVGQIITSPKDGERYVRLEGSHEAIAKDRVFKRKFCKFEEFIPKKS